MSQTKAQLVSPVGILTVSNISVSGISTLGVTTVTNLTGQQLNVSGVSTLGTLQISSGIVTATSGIITYYGDGSKLSSVISGVGIRTSGGLVGTGATVIDFLGSGISTVTVASGIATINVSGGGGGITVADDTSTNATRYPVFEDLTSGSVSTVNVSSSKLQFNPSTGTLSATIFTSLSDASQKANVHPIENPIELTKQLQGVRFNWIDNNQPSLGLIAQEVEKVLPELIETGDDGLKRVNYSSMIGLLIETVKEQQNHIEELERKLNA
jgi:hypothetical protein